MPMKPNPMQQSLAKLADGRLGLHPNEDQQATSGKTI